MATAQAPARKVPKPTPKGTADYEIRRPTSTRLRIDGNVSLLVQRRRPPRTKCSESTGRNVGSRIHLFVSRAVKLHRAASCIVYSNRYGDSGLRPCSMEPRRSATYILHYGAAPLVRGTTSMHRGRCLMTNMYRCFSQSRLLFSMEPPALPSSAQVVQKSTPRPPPSFPPSASGLIICRHPRRYGTQCF